LATNKIATGGLTLREHLEELRKRLMYTLIFVVIAVVIAFLFREAIFNFLLEPGYGNKDEKPQATEVLETVSVIFKVTLMAGFIGALPFVLYQIIMFVSPGLTGFGNEFVNPEIRISSYINVMLSLIFWMGVIFQIPLVLFGLGRLGLVTPTMLGKFRRFAIVLAFIAAAIITPTFDPVNQILVAVPIIILYELGIVLARLAQRMKNGPNPMVKRGPIMRVVARVGVLRFWRWHYRFWRGD
jgi:sec-independent protein translocase protein TatC